MKKIETKKSSIFLTVMAIVVTVFCGPVAVFARPVGRSIGSGTRTFADPVIISSRSGQNLYQKLNGSNVKPPSVQVISLVGLVSKKADHVYHPVTNQHSLPSRASLGSSSDKTTVTVEEKKVEVNGIPAPTNQVAMIKALVSEFSDNVLSQKIEQSDLETDLEIDNEKDNSLTSAFKEMLDNCDIAALTPADKAALIERLRAFSDLKKDINVAMENVENCIAPDKKTELQMLVAEKMLKSVRELRNVMNLLKKVAEKQPGGELKSSEANKFCASLKSGHKNSSDKYSEIASRMVLRYSIARAEPVFNKYQAIVEDTNENCRDNGFTSWRKMKIEQQFLAMRTYMVATRKLYKNGGKNGKSLGARYENNINAEVMLSKLTSCFQRCIPVTPAVSPPHPQPVIESQSSQNDVIVRSKPIVKLNQSGQMTQVPTPTSNIRSSAANGGFTLCYSR